MENLFIVILNMLVALVGGFVLLQALAWFLGIGKRESIAEELESDNATRQIGRNAQLIRLLNQVRSLPDLPSGQPSPEKQAVWDEYQRKNAQDAALTQAERERLIEARGYL